MYQVMESELNSLKTVEPHVLSYTSSPLMAVGIGCLLGLITTESPELWYLLLISGIVCGTLGLFCFVYSVVKLRNVGKEVERIKEGQRPYGAV